jgi:hypothetical protein
MNPTERLQMLSHLQIKICTSKERQTYLRHKIKLLSNNKCKVSVRFSIINCDQLSINEGQRQVDQVNAEPTVFGPRVEETMVPPSSFDFRDNIEEPTAMRLLTILYEDEIKYHDKAVSEMEALLREMNPAVDSSMAQA